MAIGSLHLPVLYIVLLLAGLLVVLFLVLLVHAVLAVLRIRVEKLLFPFFMFSSV